MENPAHTNLNIPSNLYCSKIRCIPLEIGARGVITARNHAVLAMVASMCGIRNLKTFRRTLGKIALVASYRIYLARNSPDWSSGKLVSP